MQKPACLTDREQAFMVLFSGVLIALGAITIPSDIPGARYLGSVSLFRRRGLIGY